MRQQLRPYQIAALQQTRDLIRADKQRILIVAPTGAGKTTIAAEIIHGAVEKGSRVLFLAHRKELIDQCSKRLDEWGVDHGVVQASHWRTRPGMPVQVASVQSYANRIADGRIKADAALIIVDEAHRSMAPSYQRLIAAHPDAVTLGLTATPVRQDGQGLGEIYQELILVAQPDELVRDRFLIEPTIYSGADVDVSGLRRSRHDYLEQDVAKLMDRPKLIGDVVSHHKRIVGRGKRTVVFAASVEHSGHLVASFAAAGIPAAHVDAETTREIRDVRLGQLRSGDIEVLCNVGILTEGWDLPSLDAAILARPTRSIGLYLQMIGRVLRPAPGKARALVLDHGSNVRRMGWPTASREWSLETGMVTKSTVAAVTNCPSCGRAIVVGTAECPGCKTDVPVKSRPPLEVVDGELREIKAEAAPVPATPGEMLSALCGFVVVARRNGMRTDAAGFPGFAAYRFQERFGRWPTATEMVEAMHRTRLVRRKEAVG